MAAFARVHPPTKFLSATGGPLVRRGARTRPAARRCRRPVRRAADPRPRELPRLLFRAALARGAVRADGAAPDRTGQHGLLPPAPPARQGPGLTRHVSVDPARRGRPRRHAPRPARRRGPVGRAGCGPLWELWLRALGFSAATVLWVNHSPGLRATGATGREFYREVGMELARFARRLRREVAVAGAVAVVRVEPVTG